MKTFGSDNLIPMFYDIMKNTWRNVQLLIVFVQFKTEKVSFTACLI